MYINRATANSFLISCAVHLAALTFAFVMTGKMDSITTGQPAFTEVSFSQIKDNRIRTMIGKIENIKKQAALFTLPEITESGGSIETGNISPVTGKPGDKTVKTLKNREYTPVPAGKSGIKIDAAPSSKDLFFTGGPANIGKTAISGNTEKGGTLKNRQPVNFKKEIDIKADSRITDSNFLDKLMVSGSGSGMPIAEEPEGAPAAGTGQSKTAAAKGISFPETTGTTGNASNKKGTYDEFSLPDSMEIQQQISGKSKGKLIPDISAADGIGIIIAGEIKKRKILQSPMPEYPEWLKGKGIEPVVTLRFTVLPDGHVKDTVFIKKTSGFVKLDRMVVADLKKWLFAPLSKGNTWKEETGEITFKFSIK